MNQLFSGCTFIALGIVLLIVHNRATTTQRENTAFQSPYLKNGGIGFLFFGLYYLGRYFAHYIG